MEIKLHNKFEIFYGDKKYVAYNTLSHNIMNRISTFSPFATYFAFGNQNGADSYSRNKMENWILSLPTTLEDIQCNIEKGQLYVKRCLTIGENQRQGLTFSELGITYSSDEDPIVCNHVNIVDENNNVVNIRKKNGIALFIRVTIYLTLSSDASKLLTSGDNKLIRALLGEYAAPQITAMRGCNLLDNSKSIKRNTPRTGTRYPCNFVANISSNQEECTLSFDFDADTGETCEILVLFDDYVVARQNLMSLGEGQTETVEITSKQDRSAIIADDYVQNITGVTDSNSNQIAGVALKKYATEFGDIVENPFDITVSDDNARFVSYDGNKIAFLSGSNVNLYQNIGYSFKKIENSIETENLKKLIIFEDNVFAIYDGMPRIALHKIENFVCTQKTINLTQYTLFDSSYDWQEVEIISDHQNSFLIGIVLGEVLRRPVVVRATYSNDTLVVNSASYAQSIFANYLYSIYQNSYCDSKICFVTNNYGGESGTYRIEEYEAVGEPYISNEIPAYYLVHGTISLKGVGRAVVAKRTSSPYIWAYFYPEVSKLALNVPVSNNYYLSQDLMHIIVSTDDALTPYKIYSLASYAEPQEFVGGFPAELAIQNATDFEFVGNILLVFFDASVKAITLSDLKTIAENFPEKNATYSVEYGKIVPIGSSPEEGVNGVFSVEITA